MYNGNAPSLKSVWIFTKKAYRLILLLDGFLTEETFMVPQFIK